MNKQSRRWWRTLNVTDAVAHTEGPHCGSLGHVIPFPKSCSLAAHFGFDAVNADRDYLRNNGPEATRSLLKSHHLQPGAVAFSVAFNASFSDLEFEESLTTFENDLALASRAGFRLCVGFVQPSSNQLTFHEHFDLLCRRLQLITPLLDIYKVRLGLEFIGPTTMRTDCQHDFIHTLDGIRSLIAAANAKAQVGIKFDALHWHTSGAGRLDIAKLASDEVVYVEINDGLKGNYDRFTLPEFQRELPGKSGVIDLDGMLRELDAIGFCGPIVVEPWNESLRKATSFNAVGMAKEALDNCLESAGIVMSADEA